MTGNKKYEITFTQDTEVTFYDKACNDTTKLYKVGDKLTAIFIGDNASNESFRDFRSANKIFSIPVYVFDSIRVSPKKRKKMKQVTVVIQIAVVMEVPEDITNPEIDDLVKNDTSWDVECNKKMVNIVEVSDILAVNSIVEATLG